jgi:hypothetical protein
LDVDPRTLVAKIRSAVTLAEATANFSAVSADEVATCR